MRRDEDLGACPLCDRPLIAGPSIDRHHWVPRSQGGRDWSYLHLICHRKVHATLDDRQIARAYRTAGALRGHPEIAAFLRWVARRPPEFMDWHHQPRHQRSRRR